jgi:L-lactate dehydrogenase complex protein LldG
MSREEILERIRKNKPAETALPALPDFGLEGQDLESRFRQAVEAVGGKMLETGGDQLSIELIMQHFPDAQTIASSLPGMPGNVDLAEIKSPLELEQVDLAVLPARLGVAENGAVWMTEEDCVHRVLPFITQHLLVALKRENLVGNMHEAYPKIRVDETGFGAFIAGPSKTADIEQALVIGAQGARSVTIALV